VSWAKQRCWLDSLFGLMLLSEEWTISPQDGAITNLGAHLPSL
jgi:hypothetical protein